MDDSAKANFLFFGMIFIFVFLTFIAYLFNDGKPIYIDPIIKCINPYIPKFTKLRLIISNFRERMAKYHQNIGTGVKHFMQMNFHLAEQVNMTKSCWLGYYEHCERLTTVNKQERKKCNPKQDTILIYWVRRR